jgi:flagellar assembly protein FliH
MSNNHIEENNVVIQSYKFKHFDPQEKNNPVDQIKEYTTPCINDGLRHNQEHQKKLSIEKNSAEKNLFKISPIVLEHRGLKRRDQEEKEKKIQEEVEKRCQQMQEEVMKKGYAEGIKLGREEVYNQTRAQTEEKLAALSAMIDEILKQKEEILVSQKLQIYQLIKNLTKWIILRELREDGKYLERLMERLVLEMQSRANILVMVSQKDFSKMPEVLKIVQDRIGEMPNVRVEIDYEITEQGMILECENGIIRGTLEEQYNSLDKLFESVEKK